MPVVPIYQYSTVVPSLKYTDDTAMTKSVAKSLIERKTFDAKDMANRSGM